VLTILCCAALVQAPAGSGPPSGAGWTSPRRWCLRTQPSGRSSSGCGGPGLRAAAQSGPCVAAGHTLLACSRRHAWACAAQVDLAALRKELQSLERLCQRVCSPSVFCHNDMLSGNILLVLEAGGGAEAAASTATGPAAHDVDGVLEVGVVRGHSSLCVGAAGLQKLVRLAPSRALTWSALGAACQGRTMQFIDFEYSCAGPRGFDLGNHFNEYAGFDCEYWRWAACCSRPRTRPGGQISAGLGRALLGA
jgi:hypothetical protein